MEPGTELKAKIFKFLDDLKPGQVIVIKQIAKKDPDLFIASTKEYIDAHASDGGIEFNSDYSKIKRLQKFLD